MWEAASELKWCVCGARHCPVLKDTSCFRESFWLPENNCKEKNEHGIWAAFVQSSCLRPYQLRVGAQPLPPWDQLHLAAGTTRRCWDHPELLRPPAPRQVSHRLTERAPCCSKFVCEMRVGFRTLNRGQASQQLYGQPSAAPCLMLWHVKRIGGLAAGYTGYHRGERQKPANGTCRASNVSYGALPNA